MVKTKTTILPSVSINPKRLEYRRQTVDFYDEHGNLIWSKDALRLPHPLSSTIRSPVALRKHPGCRHSARPFRASHRADRISSWPRPRDGQSLITDYQYDSTGRLTQTLGPMFSKRLADAYASAASWTVYEDGIHQVSPPRDTPLYTDSTATTPSGYSP